MDIVIAGAGEVGTHLANMLSKQEHNIMLIDSDEEKLELLGNQLDVMSIVGSCTSIGALKDAGVHKCDLLLQSITKKIKISTQRSWLKNLGPNKPLPG